MVVMRISWFRDGVGVDLYRLLDLVSKGVLLSKHDFIVTKTTWTGRKSLISNMISER